MRAPWGSRNPARSRQLLGAAEAGGLGSAGRGEARRAGERDARVARAGHLCPPHLAAAAGT